MRMIGEAGQIEEFSVELEASSLTGLERGSQGVIEIRIKPDFILK